jgi:hypothetical protein
MVLKKRYHLYIGLDYPENVLQGQRLLRRKFSSDATLVRTLLESPGTDSDDLVGPVTADVLKDRIRRALGDEMSGREVLIYLSGHAEREDNEAYFLTADSAPGNLGVSTEWLLKQINSASKPTRIGVVLACCYSGCPGQLLRDRFWLSASSDVSPASEEFQKTLVYCLSRSREIDVTLESMYSGNHVGFCA